MYYLLNAKLNNWFFIQHLIILNAMQLPQCGQSRPHRLDSNDTSGFHCAVRWRWRGGGEDCRDLARYLVQTFSGVENAPIHQIKDNLVSLFFPRRGDL